LKGVILADEVGLGKTIEASLVIAQHWAERRRRILLIVPSSLRKQWQQELREKFSLRSVILEARTHREAIKQGKPKPFNKIIRVEDDRARKTCRDVREPFDVAAEEVARILHDQASMPCSLMWARTALHRRSSSCLETVASFLPLTLTVVVIRWRPPESSSSRFLRENSGLLQSHREI
jgi:hypothetical protein